MGTHISGKLGNVYATTSGTATTNCVIVAGMKSWTVDYTQDALDTTDFADAGIKTFIAGLSGWSGSFEGFKDGAPVALGLQTLLELRESTATSQYWTGAALITGMHASAAADGLVSLSYDFQGTGALTPSTT